MKEYRIIVGKPYNNRSWISKYSKPCFLCASWTDEYYYADKINNDYIYKIYLCRYCRDFKNRIRPELYIRSVQNYINATWKD